MVREPRHKRGSWVPQINSVATACVVLLLVLLSAAIDVMATGAQSTATAAASDSGHTFAQGVVDGATPSMNSAKALVGPYGFRHSRAVLVVDGNATLHCIRRCDGGASSPAVIPCVAWSFPTGLPVLHTSTADHDDEVDDGSEAIAFGHAQAAARRACHPLSAPPLVHGDGQLFFPTKARRCNAEARSGDSGTAVVHRIQEDATRDATSSDGFEEDATSFVRLGSLGDFLRKQLVVVNQTQFYTTSSFTTWLLDAESGQEVPRDVRFRHSGGLLPTFEVTRFDTILHASNAVAGFAWNLTTSKFRISPSGGTPWTTRQSPQQGESVHCQDRLNVECREEQNYWRQHDINSRTTTTPLARAMQISESAREAEWQALDEVLRLWDWVPEGTKQDAAVSLVVLRDDVIPVADAKQRWQQYHADKVKEILSREAATPTSMQRMVLTAPLEPSASSGSPSASPAAEDAHHPFGRVDHHHRAHTIDGSALEEFVVSEHLIKQQRGSAASSGIASLARGQQYLHPPNIRIATTGAVSGDGGIASGDSLQRNHAQPIPHPSHRMDTHRGEAATAAEGAAFIAHTHRPVQVSWNRSTVFLAAQAGLLVVAAVLAAIGIVPRRKMQHAWAETEMERTLAQRQVAMLRSAAASSVALLRDPTTVSPFSQHSGSAPSSLPPSMRLGPSVVGCVAVTPVHDMAPCSVENIGVATVASNSSRSSAVAPLDPGALVSPEHAEDGTERRRQSSLFADMPNVSFTSHSTAMAPTSSHSVAVDTRHMGGIPRPKPAPPSSMLPAFTEVPESPHSATPGITGDDGDVPAHAASLRNVSFAGDLGSTSGTGATQSSSDGMERTNSSFHDAATETDVSGEVGMSVRALSNTSNPQEEDPRNDDEEEEDPVSPLHDNAVMSPVACLPPTENGGASASQFGDLRNLSTGSRTEDEDDDQSWWRRGLAAARGRKPGAEPLTNLTAAATSFSAMDDDEGPQSPCTNTSADLHMTHCPSSMILTDGGGDDSAASPMVHSDGDVMREASPDMDTTRGRMSVDSAASAEARRLTAPQLFQLHFKVLRRIGIGGAGCVFCVEHRVTKAQYAIKVVALEEDDVRSIREAVLHGSFDCPYVVRFFYCWIEDMSVDTAVQLGIFDRDDGLDAMSAISRDSVVAKNGHGGASTAPSTTTEEPLRLLFIQMEYFKHGTLEDWLKRRQRDWLRVLAKSRLEMAARSATLPCGGDDPVTGVMERPPLNDIGAMEIDRVDCCEYILQICKGLEYLHEQGIVHRDVKPSNIFMTEKNGVKIGDFGLASRRAGANDDVTTLAETGIGEEDTTTGCSPLYCSPEQRAGKRVTFASDVFSVGVLAIELYSPFATAHERIATLDLLRATGRVPPDLLTAFPEEMALINHLLVLQPLQRPQMSAVIAKLKGVIKVLKASARKRGGLNGTPHDDLVSQPGSPERRAKPSEGVVGGAVPNGDMSLTTLPSAFGDQFHAGRTHLVDESDSDGSDSSSPTPIDRDVDGDLRNS